MDILQLITLALIQGITEFLPISSSAHLILPKEILSWPDQGLAFDVAVHLGSLVAVLAYFRRDVVQLIVGWFASFSADNKTNADGKLGWCIIVATLPAAFAGLLLGGFIEDYTRSIKVIAVTTIVFAFVLWWADVKGENKKQLTEMTIRLAIVIGVAQALALVPGTSRSGITITAALILGFTRVEAARFSFLLAIPVILLSGGYMSLKLLGEQVDWTVLLTGAVVSGISAWFCIHYFLGFINRIGMLPFVVYRLILGAVLTVLILI